MGVIPSIANHPKQLGEHIRRRSHWLWIPDLMETTALPGVAGNISHLFNAQEESIAITIVANPLHLLKMARGFPLMP